MAKLIISENNLEGELQELAIENWSEFCNLIGTEALTTAKICHLKKEGKSLQQIANKLHITKRQAQTRCNKCNK